MKALVCVDIQLDFIDTYEKAALPVPGSGEVVPKIQEHLFISQGRYDLIASTQDWHPPILPGHFDDWPAHCVAWTEGAKISPQIADFPFDTRIYKGMKAAAYSGFEGEDYYGKSLHDILRLSLVKDVYVIGFATDYCVLQTAKDARKLGYNTKIIGELTAAVNGDPLEIANEFNSI